MHNSIYIGLVVILIILLYAAFYYGVQSTAQKVVNSSGPIGGTPPTSKSSFNINWNKEDTQPDGMSIGHMNFIGPLGGNLKGVNYEKVLITPRSSIPVLGSDDILAPQWSKEGFIPSCTGESRENFKDRKEQEINDGMFMHTQTRTNESIPFMSVSKSARMNGMRQWEDEPMV